MNISSMSPQIITKDAESIIELFQALGFEKQHNPKGIGELKVEGIRMKDRNGFCLDISVPEIQLPQDATVIRVNVDHFEEAYRLLIEHGFRNFYGEKIVETEYSDSALMIAPSGFAINLVHHIKK